jgi:hypothetical protein
MQEFNPSKSVQNLPSVFFSPSTNFIHTSPNSLERWIDSYSREKINVMKLVKLNQEIKNRIRSKENSRHSSAKKAPESKTLSIQHLVETKKENIFSEEIFAKKNLMKLFDNNNNNLHTCEENINSLDLLKRKSERLEDEEFSDEECFHKSSRSNLGEILNSPLRKNSVDSITHIPSSSNKTDSQSTAKKKLFFCSAQKSFSTSEVKSCCPTLNSSEKKERRRLRKTTQQLQILQTTYKQHHNKEWNKEMITEISSQIGLEETKVYKWLWDKKNKEMSDKKVFFIQSGSKYKLEKTDIFTQMHHTEN